MNVLARKPMRFKSSLKTFKLPSALSQNGQCAQPITGQLGDTRGFLMEGILAQSKDAVMTHASSDSLPLSYHMITSPHTFSLIIASFLKKKKKIIVFLSFPYKTINLSKKRVPGKNFPFFHLVWLLSSRAMQSSSAA